MATTFVYFNGESSCLNCDGHQECEIEFDVNNKTVKVTGCIKKMITYESRKMLNLYQHYKNGFLYTAGGLINQPAVYINSMAIIQNAIAQIEIDERKKNGHK